ncbi:MAG TPA: DeoR family transcriptional regulator [Firmicutes bacterium]|nr:DeoR family transcriptional regulator [Bacillota bacterium]
MAGSRNLNKSERHRELLRRLQENPLLTDEELASAFGVSVQTIRLDRMELDIAELRERLKSLVSRLLEGEQFIQGYRTMGDVVVLEPGQRVISSMAITPDMVVPRTQIVRPYYLVAQAHTAALHVLPEGQNVFTADANVKFLRPVKVGERLIAAARLADCKQNRWCIKVTTKSRQESVFRGTFHMLTEPQKG